MLGIISVDAGLIRCRRVQEWRGNGDGDSSVRAKEEKCQHSQHQHYKTDKNNGSNSAGPVIGYQTRPLVYRLANRRLSDITTPLCRFGFLRVLRGGRVREMPSLWLELDARSRPARVVAAG